MLTLVVVVKRLEQNSPSGRDHRDEELPRTLLKVVQLALLKSVWKKYLKGARFNNPWQDWMKDLRQFRDHYGRGFEQNPTEQAIYDGHCLKNTFL